MDILLLAVFILVTLFGLGFLFAPAPLLIPFGVTLDAAATVFARLFGSTLLGYAILTFFARAIKVAVFRRTVVYSLFFYYMVSTVLLLTTELARLMNGLGWILVGLHFVFTLWTGYFAFTKSA